MVCHSSISNITLGWCLSIGLIFILFLFYVHFIFFLTNKKDESFLSSFSDLIINSSEIKLLALVGRGGFGEVWKAHWSGCNNGVIVAVKKIKTFTPDSQVCLI
jgi:hypothetical protein